jgi:exodeoxyribonuclease III
MRLVAWNIRAGGGNRVDAIAHQLDAWGTDVAVLSEFRGTSPSRTLASILADLGLGHQRTSVGQGGAAVNEMLLASRWPLRPMRLPCAPSRPGRWVAATVQAPKPVAVAGLHVPLGRANATIYMEAALRTMERWRHRQAIIAGDTNSGRPAVDEESPVFGLRHSAWFDAIEALGWRDSFRHLHPEAREFTWYSPNRGNGFRLDQAFVSPRLADCVAGVEHAWGHNGEAPGRRDGLSDHAAVILDVDPGARSG